MSYEIHVFEAPTTSLPASSYDKQLFLAGGISGCGNWHKDMIDHLMTKCVSTDKPNTNTKSLALYNPRRENFDVSDQSQSEIQIKWEHEYLHTVQAVSFWFCSETLCPITVSTVRITLNFGLRITHMHGIAV